MLAFTFSHKHLDGEGREEEEKIHGNWHTQHVRTDVQSNPDMAILCEALSTQTWATAAHTHTHTHEENKI